MVGLDDVEASLFKYLYDTLEVEKGIAVHDSITLEDFSAFTKWVVMDTLNTYVGAQPKTLYFLRAAVQHGMKNESTELASLVDTVVNEVDGANVPIYDYETEELVGNMNITVDSISPAIPHSSGGSFRSITLTVTYEGHA